jgi:PAS domain-containing protein
MSVFPELEQIRRRIERLHAGAEPADEVLQDLETMYEELETAEEELRSQQDHIARLVDAQESLVRQQERMLALLPVAMLVTDAYGAIRASNAAAAQLFAVPAQRLIGKPVFALVPHSSRHQLRSRLAEHVATGALQWCRSAALRRGDQPQEVDVSIAAIPGLPDACTWILMPADQTTRQDDAPHPREPLSETLIRLTSLSSQSDDVAGLLRAATEVLREALPDSVTATIAVGPPGSPDAISSTAAHAQELDGAQLSAGEGPTLTAFATVVAVDSADLAHDERWPRLAFHLPADIGGAVAVPLEVGGHLFGALTLYRGPGTSSTGLAETARLVGAAIAAAIHEVDARGELATLADNLREALKSRAGIEQAKGVLMARHGYDAESAFAHLVHLSSTQHLKLREIARSIVDEAATTSPSVV